MCRYAPYLENMYRDFIYRNINIALSYWNILNEGLKNNETNFHPSLVTCQFPATTQLSHIIQQAYTRYKAAAYATSQGSVAHI